MKISCVLGFLCNVIVLISPCTAHLIQGNKRVLSQYDGISIVHTVTKGETLSTIAARYYYTFRAQDIIQHINNIPDAHLIFPGQQLIIPTNNYFLEQHGVQDQLNRTRFLLQKDRTTDHLFIGIDVCMKEDRIHKGYCDNLSDDKFIVLQLYDNGRQKLMFHSSYFEEEYWGSGTWDFIDLDGDGNVDLLGEWSQGSVNNTTHIALHFSDDTYRPCQIIDQLALGDFSTSRDHDHTLIFEYIPRYSDERVVIKWNDRMEVCLVDSPRLSFEQIIQATVEPDPLKGLTAFEGLFADPELLESVVTTALANGWTTPEHVTKIDHASEIIDLEGIQHLINLETLRIYDSRLRDLSPLQSLANLKTLYLPENSISNISPLKDLTSLRALILWGNHITDISALTALTSLVDLNLNENGLSDISPLKGLINLTSLELRNNAISDLSPLAHLTTLENLVLYDNHITDISPLRDLMNLTTLRISGNNISDISAVSNHTKLKTLSVHNNNITDISAISKLKSLEILWLAGNHLTDLSGLANLTEITRLHLAGCNISEISWIDNLTNLTELYLQNNKIHDISYLTPLTRLRELSLGNNQITDIASLENLINLTTIWLGKNRITDITPLLKLPKLKHVTLDGGQGVSCADLAALWGKIYQEEFDSSSMPPCTP